MNSYGYGYSYGFKLGLHRSPTLMLYGRVKSRLKHDHERHGAALSGGRWTVHAMHATAECAFQPRATYLNPWQ